MLFEVIDGLAYTISVIHYHKCVEIVSTLNNIWRNKFFNLKIKLSIYNTRISEVFCDSISPTPVAVFTNKWCVIGHAGTAKPFIIIQDRKHYKPKPIRCI